jgi:hypothetical protein
MKIKKIGILLVLIIVCLNYLAILCWIVYQFPTLYQNFSINHNKIADGEVIGRYGLTKIVSFYVNGQKIEGIAQGYSGKTTNSYKVKVHYNEENPYNFYIDDGKINQALINIFCYLSMIICFRPFTNKLKIYYKRHKEM